MKACYKLRWAHWHVWMKMQIDDELEMIKIYRKVNKLGIEKDLSESLGMPLLNIYETNACSTYTTIWAN